MNKYHCEPHIVLVKSLQVHVSVRTYIIMKILFIQSPVHLYLIRLDTLSSFMIGKLTFS